MMHAADYEEPTDHEEDREHAEAMADGYRDFEARCVELARAQAAREQDTSCFLCGAIGDLLSAGSGQRVKCRDPKGCAARRRDGQVRAKSPQVWR